MCTVPSAQLRKNAIIVHTAFNPVVCFEALGVHVKHNTQVLGRVGSTVCCLKLHLQTLREMHETLVRHVVLVKCVGHLFSQYCQTTRQFRSCAVSQVRCALKAVHPMHTHHRV